MRQQNGMKQVGAVVLRGDMRYVEVPPPPIRSSEVLAKVLGAVLTPTDVAAVRGYLPYTYGKVVGSAGVVRVLELGADVEGLSVGENAVVAPRCFVELATSRDGIMAELASVRAQCLEPVPQSISGADGAYLSLLAHIPSVLSSLSGSSILIAGCGYEAQVLAGVVRDEVRADIVCASDAGLRRVARLGIRAYLVEAGERNYDAVYVASLDPLVVREATRRCAGTLYISPLVPEHLVPLNTGIRRVVAASRLRLNLPKALELARGSGKQIESAMKVVNDLKAVVDAATYRGGVVYLSKE